MCELWSEIQELVTPGQQQKQQLQLRALIFHPSRSTVDVGSTHTSQRPKENDFVKLSIFNLYLNKFQFQKGNERSGAKR